MRPADRQLDRAVYVDTLPDTLDGALHDATVALWRDLWAAAHTPDAETYRKLRAELDAQRNELSALRRRARVLERALEKVKAERDAHAGR